MNEIWTERIMYTEVEQKVAIKPNEEMTGIVIEISEIDDPKDSYRLYLHKKEAHKLAELIIEHAAEYCS
jgi:hypothetical protein